MLLNGYVDGPSCCDRILFDANGHESEAIVGSVAGHEYANDSL